MGLPTGAYARLKWILIAESVFAGAYASLTSGLFGVFLASVGQGVEGASTVLFASVIVSIPIGLLLRRHPSFLRSRTKLKLTAFHALEICTWPVISLTHNALWISVLYSIYRTFSFLTGILLTFIVYGSLAEDQIRDVTAKRSAASGVSIILGFGLGVFLLAFLPIEGKFTYVFSLGAILGLFSTLLALFLDLSHLEKAQFPEVTAQPEKVFTASSFFLVLLASGNLLGIVWTPYIMHHLHGPDFLAASMALVGTISSMIASLTWSNKSFKVLRVGLALNALGPILILVTPWPTLHVPIRAYTSFVFTGANFVGTFLFAKYNEWLGAVKSSVLLIILANIAQLVAASLGILIKENYLIAFSLLFAIDVAATVLAVLAIPEVAIVPEDMARTYSRALYISSLLGYRMAIEYSRETVVGTLRLLACFLTISLLYLIYRIVWILMG